MRRRARVGVAARRPPRAHSRCVRCRMNTRMAGAGGVNRTRQTATQHPWRKMAHGIAQLREVEMPDTRYCYQVVAASVDTLEVNGLNRMAEHITEQMTALQQAAIAERDTHRTRGKRVLKHPGSWPDKRFSSRRMARARASFNSISSVRRRQSRPGMGISTILRFTCGFPPPSCMSMGTGRHGITWKRSCGNGAHSSISREKYICTPMSPGC